MNKVEKIAENRAKQLSVETVTLFNDVVSIEYYLPEWNECKTLEVPADRYEKHLTEIAAMDWAFQVTEGNVYKDDVSGKMSLAEYFADVDMQDKNKDAVSYLKCNIIDRNAMPDIFGAIAAISKDFVGKIKTA